MTWWLVETNKQKKFNAKKLRDLRKHYGLSLADMENMTGISDSFIWEVENGFKNPSKENSLKIEKALENLEKALRKE